MVARLERRCVRGFIVIVESVAIDTYAAGIVKEIFRLKLHGMSQDAIATQLNNEGVLCLLYTSC